MPFADHDGVELRRLALASIHHQSHLADQELTIETPGGGDSVTICVEVEYWYEEANVEPTIAAVRVWEDTLVEPTKTNPLGRGPRRYLPSPNWLQEVLILVINTSKLQGELL